MQQENVSARQAQVRSQAVLIKEVPLTQLVLALQGQLGMKVTVAANAHPVAHGMRIADNAYVMQLTAIQPWVFTAKQIVAHKGNLMCRVLITARTLAVQVAQEKHTTLMQV